MAKKLWGGRFSKDTDRAVEAFTESISFDCRLIAQEIVQSSAHAAMLGKCGIVSLDESKKMIKGLGAILKDYQAGKIEFDASAEDIHMNVEKLLHRADRRDGQEAAYGAKSQRSGRVRCSAVSARRDRPDNRADSRTSAGDSRSGGGERGSDPAGVYAPPARAAGIARALSDVLVLDAGAG